MPKKQSKIYFIKELLKLSKKKYKLAYALGGGGAKGLVHIGILKFLEEKNIFPDLIVGTSMGSLIGGLYAIEKSSNFVYEKIKKFLDSEYNPETFEAIKSADYKEERDEEGFFYSLKRLFARGVIYSKTFTNLSIISRESFEKDLKLLVPEYKIEDLKIDFFSISVDLYTGREIVIKGGDLRKSIAASCAIPGVFPPVKSGKYLLVDGGWVDKNPVLPAKILGAKKVLCFNCTNTLEKEESFESALSIILRSDNIATHRLGKIQTLEADFVFKPNLEEIHWVDFDSIDKIVEIGYNYAKETFNEVEDVLKGKWFEFFTSRKKYEKIEMEFIEIK